MRERVNAQKEKVVNRQNKKESDLEKTDRAAQKAVKDVATEMIAGKRRIEKREG